MTRFVGDKSYCMPTNARSFFYLMPLNNISHEYRITERNSEIILYVSRSWELLTIEKTFMKFFPASYVCK